MGAGRITLFRNLLPRRARGFCTQEVPAFNTHRAAVKLREAGFSDHQVCSIVECLSDAALKSEERVGVSSKMELELQLSKMELTLNIETAQLRNELKAMEVADFRKLCVPPLCLASFHSTMLTLANCVHSSRCMPGCVQ